MQRPPPAAVPLHGPPITLEADSRRIRLTGDLDTFSGRLIEDELLELALARRSSVVDLSGLQVLTSGGLAVLERCRDQAVAHGHRFILAVPGATMVQQVLAFAGVRHYVLRERHRDGDALPRQRRPEPEGQRLP